MSTDIVFWTIVVSIPWPDKHNLFKVKLKTKVMYSCLVYGISQEAL